MGKLFTSESVTEGPRQRHMSQSSKVQQKIMAREPETRESYSDMRRTRHASTFRRQLLLHIVSHDN